MTSETRIGVLDSGVGGLSIYSELRAIFPELAIDYCLDQINFPYGTKSEEQVREFSLKLAIAFHRASRFNILVIACNTVSTIALQEIRAALPDCEVVGVVPAVKTAATLTATRHIAVLATERAVAQPYLYNLIESFANDCKVEMIGSKNLVDWAEAKIRGEYLSQEKFVNELKPILNEPQIDCVVLGCTHFPLLKENISSVLPDRVRLIDSGKAIARRVLSISSSLKSDSSSLQSTKYPLQSIGYTNGDPTKLWRSTAVPIFVRSLGLDLWKTL